MRLTMQQRRAVVAKMASRYQRSRKKEKSTILSELVELTEYSRAYDMRVLRQQGATNQVRETSVGGGCAAARTTAARALL